MVLPSDATVIIPTVSELGIEFLTCLRLCLQTEPLEILVVTTNSRAPSIVDLLRQHYLPTSIRVLGVPRANKRLQLLRGLEEVKSEVTVFADDDVFWPQNFLINLLAAFEDPTVGSAGSCQRVRRATRTIRPNAWHVLGAFRLVRRNFETCATAHMDGGVSCLSGRTAAYRTSALRTAEFERQFSAEKWLHRSPLKTADDDKFVTRWVYGHRWRTKIQCSREAELETTLRDDLGYLAQCIRWERTRLRSNLTALFYDRFALRAQCYSLYAVYLKTLFPPTAISDPLMGYLLYCATNRLSHPWQTITMILFVLWLLGTKAIKILPHLKEHPKDIFYLPAEILFGYAHGLLEAYAIATLTSVAWGGRELGQKATTDDHRYDETPEGD
ncbi:MAG: hypothetical protein M1836_003384 [Candelina mexicana]|nr:MAG: hypothetical protein M1836_003384 [Candelina mexicana]